MTPKTEYEKMVGELQECAAGTRGWVRMNLSRLRKCGITLDAATIVCRDLGLAVGRHGKHGWSASR